MDEKELLALEIILAFARGACDKEIKEIRERTEQDIWDSLKAIEKEEHIRLSDRAFITDFLAGKLLELGYRRIDLSKLTVLSPTEIGDSLDLEIEATYPGSDGSKTSTISIDKLLNKMLEHTKKQIEEMVNGS